MAITQALCNSFKEEILEAVHDFGPTPHTFKIALYTSSATLGASTTAYTASNEVTGAGYTAGGETLTGVSATLSGSTAIIDFADVSWTSASFTARGALIYNTSASNAAVLVLDFGSDQTVSNGTFEIQFPTAGASTAIIRIA